MLMGKSRLLTISLKRHVPNLIAYRVAPLSPRVRSLSRGDWNPLILFVLLGVLVLVVSVQIIVIYTYGGATSDFSYAAFYSGHGYGGFGASGLFARWGRVSPPPRINIYKLLDQHVPSIEANKRIIYEKINADYVQSLIRENAHDNVTYGNQSAKHLPDCSPDHFSKFCRFLFFRC